jgi:hypothetical protein
LRPPPWGALWASASRRSSSRPTSARCARTRPRREIRRQINGMGRIQGLPRRGPPGGRGQERPLGPMPCGRPTGDAQAGAALLLRRRVTAQQRPGTALRCAVTSGVEAGNGVADEEAERLGGASQIGRRCLRVALAGNLSNRAPDASAYAQSKSSPRFSLRGAKMCPEPFDTREGRSSAPTPPSDQAPPPAPAGIRADSSRRR